MPTNIKEAPANEGGLSTAGPADGKSRGKSLIFRL